MKPLRQWVPMLEWAPSYNRHAFGRDVLAAVIVTLLLIPQSLAYATLAGLPAQVGLYASIVPLILYAVFGTSRTLSVGPVAIVALMVASTAGAVATQGTPEYIGAVLLLACLSGLILIAMGLARLGFLANFLSHPVISGFMTASAFIIATSQLGPLLGFPISGSTLPELGAELVRRMGSVHGPTLALGGLTLVFLYAARWSPLEPNLVRTAPLVALIVTTALSWWLDLADQGVAVIGDISGGLPALTIPPLDPDLWSALFMGALLISIVGFVESISMAQTLAARRRQRIDPDQELIALGSANLGASFSSGMPVTGSFSRSVVNFEANAETPAASLYTALGIALVTALFTPLISYLPLATLSATIVVAVLSLVDLPIIKRTWNYSVSDFAAMLATSGVTLLVGGESGIIAGVGLSLGLHLYRTSRPHSAVLGRVPGTEHFRNVDRHEVETDEELLVVRVDESLYFANAQHLEDRIQELIAARPSVRELILTCQAVNTIDASALESLETINRRLNESGVRFHLAVVKGPVMDRLRQTDFLEALTGGVFLSTYHAWEVLRERSGSNR